MKNYDAMVEAANECLKLRGARSVSTPLYKVFYGFFERKTLLKNIYKSEENKELINTCFNLSAMKPILTKIGGLSKTEGLTKAKEDVCYARLLYDRSESSKNTLWTAHPCHTLPQKKVLKFFRLCKKGKLLPSYLDVKASVSPKGDVSAFLNTTKGSKYDQANLLYIYLTVLRFPREDHVTSEFMLGLMEAGFHPIVAWLFASRCSSDRCGHNFTSLCLGYPSTVPKNISEIKIEAEQFMGTWGLVNFKGAPNAISTAGTISCSSALRNLGAVLLEAKGTNVKSMNIVDADKLLMDLDKK